MEIDSLAIPKCPPKFRDYLRALRSAIQTVRPIPGDGISMSAFTEIGTVVNSIAAAPPSTTGNGGGGPGSITVTAEDASGYTPGSGVGSVSGVTTLTFDHDVFEIFDGGGGQCVVRLKTCDAPCPCS